MARFISLLLALTLVSCGQFLRADVFEFELRSGGRLQGDWLNPKERPLKSYLVQTQTGGQVLLAKSQVKRLIRHRPEELQYSRIAPTYADTVEAQWELAEWCRQNRLLTQRNVHLKRIIQWDADHTKARRGLGYTQLGSRWLTRDEWRKAQGYVFYRGKWRLEQEVDLLEVSRKKETAERAWLAKLKRLGDGLQSSRAAEARDQILAIRDPNAVRALRGALRSDRSRRVKQLYIETLGKISDHSALVALINTSLNDPDVETFHSCIEEVVQRQSPYATMAYIEGLKNHNNSRVNRSAYALGQMGDPRSVGPLIDALVTTHQMVVAPSSGSGMPISTTFVTPQTGGDDWKNGPLAQLTRSANNPTTGNAFSTGGKPQIVSARIPNQEVLNALSKLSGVSFGFDQKAWHNWVAAERRQTRALTSRSR